MLVCNHAHSFATMLKFTRRRSHLFAGICGHSHDFYQLTYPIGPISTNDLELVVCMVKFQCYNRTVLRDRVLLSHPADPQVAAAMRKLAQETGIPMARHYDRAAAEYLDRLASSPPNMPKATDPSKSGSQRRGRRTNELCIKRD